MWTQGIAANTTNSIHCDSNHLTQNLRSPTANDDFSSNFQETRRSGSGRHEQFQPYIRDRDLIELRGRCSQLEKTVRWWSDCTNNWREKWSCVRDERNHLREELRRTKLALTALQRQNEELNHRLDEFSISENKNDPQTLAHVLETPNPTDSSDKSKIEQLERENSELKDQLALLTQRLSRSDHHSRHRLRCSRSSGASSCSGSRSPSTSGSGCSGSHSGSASASVSSHTSLAASPTPPKHDKQSKVDQSSGEPDKSWSM
ncbi:unnamed protein product [Hymenolepis diminuta]|uniref:Coiled-coil domain-containing protein 102A n=1 Tax=Hymenolepis diminuta TaxID=6216 RepID=A0A564ZCM3_HYMDI|nr:unnamed protein product [Hymenolepis diminuta]